MRISPIIPDLNNQKVEINKPQNKLATSPIATDSIAPTPHAYTHQVLFGTNAGLIGRRPFLNVLSDFHGIISPYDGKPMFPSYVFRKLQEQLSIQTPLEYTKTIINTLSRPNNKACLRENTSEVFNRIRKVSASNPEMNLYEIMQELRMNYIGELYENQMGILNKMDSLAHRLSPDAREDVRALINMTRDEIALTKEDEFRNKIFIENLNEINSRHISEDKEVFKEIFKQGKLLPDSRTSADAFITKYSRSVKFEKGKDQMDLIAKVENIEDNIKALGRRKYDKIEPFIFDLKTAIITNKNYSGARKNLINNLKLIASDKEFEQYFAINNKIINLPKNFVSPEEDLKLRMLAITKRMVGDATMSAEHIRPQSDYQILIDGLNATKENARKNKEWDVFNNAQTSIKKLENERDSIENLIIADAAKNTDRSSTDFAKFIQTNPKIITHYIHAHFESIFLLFNSGKISKAFLPDLEKMINSVEYHSRGLIRIQNPFEKAA